MEQGEELEEEIPGEIPSEEKTEEKEAVKPEKEEETEGRVIEIHPPPPFDEATLNPFIDVFMAKRGLADRKKAAVKLADVLFRMGYDPRKDIQNVTTYINNLSTVLNSMPDTPETIPVKGALLARGAVESAGMIGQSHFGERNVSGIDPELQQMIKMAQKAKITMKILDSAFTGDSNSGSGSSEVKELTARLNRLEGDKALDAKLAPLYTGINDLKTTVQALLTKDSTKKPPEESPGMKDVKTMFSAMEKRLDGIDQRYQFSNEVQGIKTEIATLKTLVEKGGGKPGNVSDVFDQTIALMDKISEVTKKYGGAGFGEGEYDWRAAALSAASEIGTEAIAAARDIYTERSPAELREDKTVATEKISERVVDHRLLSYIQKKTAVGALEFNSLDAARKVGASNEEVLASYQRLVQKGILKGGGADEAKSGEKEQPAEEEWVDG